MARPVTSLSLDLDDKWSYLKIHGDAWEHMPSYIPELVPKILKILDDRGLTITVFIVGQDAALDRNAEALASIAEAGHEIGNHSFSHDPWLHKFEAADLRHELVEADERISAVTGCQLSGFRGPGYSLSETTLDVLTEMGYDYDASTFPNVLNPVGRIYYLRTGDFTPEEREKRAMLFGTWKDTFRPITPYRLKGRSLVEVPVTTLPGLRLPIHFSYVLWLATHSELAARTYFKGALRWCRLTGTAPSLLLHPLDFLGADEDDELAFFPGMAAKGADKRRIIGDLLDMLAAEFEPITMGAQVAQFADLPGRELALPR